MLFAARNHLCSSRRFHLYRREPAEPAGDDDGAPPVRRDCIRDLLAYEPAPGLPSKRKLVCDALARIEAGQHLYTCADSTGLLHFAWLIERVAAGALDGALRAFPFPPDGALLLDAGTHPRARGRGLATRCLRAMPRDASRCPGTRAVFAAVPAGSDAARRLVEKAGFTYAATAGERTMLGWSRPWVR